MTNVEALKALYVALGNEAVDVENANTIVDVLNVIAAKYDGKDDATLNSEGIENITAVLDNIIPEPVPSENNAKFAATPTTFVAQHNLESVDIPDGVTSIGDNAFYNFGGLKNINIPTTVTSIGGNAFYECRGITEINIPNSVTSIGGSAFRGCIGLSNIEIPNGVKAIQAGTFMGCIGLTNVVIPDNIESIGSNAFQNCSALKTITIDKPKGSITGAPWGAPATTQIIWNG